MATVVNWSLSDKTLRKKLLHLSKQDLVKACKFKQVPYRSTSKRQNVDRLLHANKKNKNKKYIKTQSVISNKTQKKRNKDNQEQSSSIISSSKEPITYFTEFELDKIQINEKLIHRNKSGKLVLAKIIGRKDSNLGTNLQIHYKYIDENEQSNDIWSDYNTKTETRKFVKPPTKNLKLKSKSNKFVDLKEGDDVDINPIYNGHSGGWRCGEVEEIDEKTDQIKVFYEHEDDCYTVWVHSSNTKEIAECGDKVNPLDMLENQYFEPYFNLKKNGGNMEIIQPKLRDCLQYISDQIEEKCGDVDEEKKANNETTDDITELIEYLNAMRYDLYDQMICCNLSSVTDDEALKNIKDDFHQMYGSAVEKLKLKIDKMHLNIAKSDYTIDISNDDEKISEGNSAELAVIKKKWLRLIDPDINKNVKKKDANCSTDCIATERIEFLLKYFDKYFIKRDEQSDDEKEECVGNDGMDFMLIYNKSLNDKEQYPPKQLINDLHHINQYHIDEIVDDIPICRDTKCILKLNEQQFSDSAKSDSYFGYTSTYDINIIKSMAGYHIRFQHKDISDNSSSNSVRSNLNTGNIVTDRIDRIDRSQKFRTEIDKQQSPKFQVGQRFFYSEHYENDKGYIKRPKWKNLKKELLNNNIHQLAPALFHDSLYRAINLSLSKKGKSVKAGNYGQDNENFGVAVDCPISIAHLLCIVVYTDYTKPQHEFKKRGCRKLAYEEEFEKVKVRNSEIGNWYWLFYQTVLFYGEDANPKQILFHGLSIRFRFASFKPSFDCPVSATTDWKIAQQFATGNGIILMLKATNSSHDRCMDVSWISGHPQEKEVIFCSASYLSIIDIRFYDKLELIQWSSSHADTISAMRLFDYIFNKKCSYNYKLIRPKIQQLLVKYLKYETFMDEIKEFNIENVVHEEYDTDAVNYDINYNDNDLDDNSNILQYILTNFDENTLLSFKEHSSISAYVRRMFRFIKSELGKWVKKKKSNKVHIIKSEFEGKLNGELQNELNKFIDLYCKNDIVFIKEFEWIIEEKEFEQLKLLPIGEQIEGTHFKWDMDDDNNEYTMSFKPIIQRSDVSFPQNCSVGLQIMSVSSDEVQSFCWSFAVKEIEKFSCDLEHSIKAEDEECIMLKAFKNEHLSTIDRITLQMYIRRF